MSISSITAFGSCFNWLATVTHHSHSIDQQPRKSWYSYGKKIRIEYELICATATCASVLEARLPHSNYFHTHIVFIPIHALRFSFFHPRLSSSLYPVQTYQVSTQPLINAE